MPADLRITIDGGTPIDLDVFEALGNLTGDEGVELEDFIGGWPNFDPSGKSTRSMYVIYFLARHSVDPTIKLKDVLKERGIMFGDRVEIDDIEGVDAGPPAEGGETPSSVPAPSETSGAGT